MIRAAAVAAGVAAVAVVAAPPASASPLSYLRALDVMGVPVGDTRQIVQTGWDVCDALEVYPAADVGVTLYTSYSDVTSMEQAAGIVVAAASQLCPALSWRLDEASANASAPVEGPLKRRLV